ncbi:Ig-like domain-containing protein [Paraglaciecola aquimarina]|uniref:Ig-like domain-containing protein n=1 Tax=Paraglaciecola algarum TaxID=3050085 RepID=A0ABS9DBT7_9ALTE|nr:Ig-like domain-containing protein [Paraglaciecola sp. G1-23]MCF2949492.1 Ig-like domain-containing protein [Paraglaciecola sp. G1-23]
MLKVMPWILVTAGLAASPLTVLAKTETVINVNVKHSINGQNNFDRRKFMNIHSTVTDPDWVGEEDKLEYLMEDLDVYFGRDNGGSVWNFNQAKQDPNNAGYVDPEDMAARGKQSREVVYGINKAALHKYDSRSDIMIGGQAHPHWKALTKPCCNNAEGWQANGADAVGDFFGRYLTEFYRNDNDAVTDGHQRPNYVEVLNEPLWELINGVGPDETPATELEVFEFHNGVAQGIRRHHPDVKIGGYTSAFPWFERNNFQRWEENMKLFIDTAGENMDFYSLHFYDLAHNNNTFRGGRLESTFDMVDHYSSIKFGQPKEYIISEYGGRNIPLESKPWSPIRDWALLRSASPMMMQLMDRPDSIIKSIPFITVKAAWGTKDGIPYPWRLLRQAKEGENEEGENWVFSELVKFYELWSDVNGTRVDTLSTNPNLLVDSYVASNKVYVIVSNLTASSESVLLRKRGADSQSIEKVKVKHLYLDGATPVLDVQEYAADINSIELAPEATAIIEYSYNDPIAIDNSSEESRYFATEYYKEIAKNTASTFTIENVSLNAFGEAVLRVVVGRDHGSSLAPNVVLNGQVLSAINISGDSQEQRERFFGLLEFPVDNALLQETNNVSITFPDDGGHIASVNMKVFKFDNNIRPTDGVVDGIYLSSDSKLVGVGSTLELTTSITPFYAANKSIVYSSSDINLATVDTNGVVKGLQAGNVVITATAVSSGITAEIEISIEEPVASSFSFDDPSIYTSTLYKSGDVMTVTTQYEAGTGFVVNNLLGGVEYRLRHLASNWSLINDVAIVNDSTAINEQRGTSSVDIPLTGLTATADLENGEFYFLFVRFKNTNGETKTLALANIKIEKDQVIVEPSLTFDDAAKYKSTVYTTDSTLDVTALYQAGNNNTVTNELGGVKFFLREMTADWSTVVNDTLAYDESPIDKQSGTATASIPLTGLTPSSALADGNFYFLYAQFKASDGTIYKTSGVANINIEQGLVAASFSLDNASTYLTTEYEVGTSMDVTINFEAGTGNTVTNQFNGVRYFLRQINVVNGAWVPVKDVIVEDNSVIGRQTGSSQVSLPLTGLLATADLPEGNFYFLFAQARTSDNQTMTIALPNIKLVKPAAIIGDWDGDGDVDSVDIRGLMSAVLGRQTIDMVFDINNDGVVNMFDARALAPLCTRTRCAIN